MKRNKTTPKPAGRSYVCEKYDPHRLELIQIPLPKNLAAYLEKLIAEGLADCMEEIILKILSFGELMQQMRAEGFTESLFHNPETGERYVCKNLDLLVGKRGWRG
jgi:hypothetical protein